MDSACHLGLLLSWGLGVKGNGEEEGYVSSGEPSLTRLASMGPADAVDVQLCPSGMA